MSQSRALSQRHSWLQRAAVSRWARAQRWISGQRPVSRPPAVQPVSSQPVPGQPVPGQPVSRVVSGQPVSGRSAVWGRAGVVARAGSRDRVDWRRALQLGLAGLWLLDGVLQYQSVMFTRSFPAMLASSAAGNPAFIAGPITWSARLTQDHLGAANGVFAAVQLALGLGIAWRPALRAALAASIVWSLAVWWLGEGFGQVLAGTASPVNGAPGAVILYALLAVLVWPARSGRAFRLGTATAEPGAGAGPFVAAGLMGGRAARLVWLVLWGSLAYLAVQPAVRAPGALSGLLADAADGEPAWLARLDGHAARALGQHGLAASIVLAVLLAAAAAGIFGPPRWRRGVIVLAVVLSGLIWAAQGFGGLLTGGATDPESGPLLALIAVAYWPARRAPLDRAPLDRAPLDRAGQAPRMTWLARVARPTWLTRQGEPA